jgi:TatD DNase family protein
MIDSHIHLDADPYADREGVIKRARAAGVTAAVVPGVSPESNRRVLELSADYRGFVKPALGLHPERPEITDSDVAATLAMLEVWRDSICAVGEVGLPWYGEAARRPGAREKGQAILARFARAAADLELALILHCPHGTAANALAIIRSAGVRRAVFHWHKSDEATTREIIEAGYFVSLTPEVVYRERDQALARIVPLGNLLVETDGPWPYGGPFAGQVTEPAMLARAVAALARIKGESERAVAEATAENTRLLFLI